MFSDKLKMQQSTFNVPGFFRCIVFYLCCRQSFISFLYAKYFVQNAKNIFHKIVFMLNFGNSIEKDFLYWYNMLLKGGYHEKIYK